MCNTSRGCRHLRGDMNARLLLLLGGCSLLAACGPQSPRTASHTSPARPASVTSDAASPSPAQSAGATAQPAPVEPPPPLIVVRSPNGMVAATTPGGTFLWSFDPGTVGIATPTLVTGGPNLFAYGDSQVAVIDRTGTVIGHGAYTKGQGPGSPELLPEPTGVRWAWLRQDAAPASGDSTTPQVNSLWVGGLGLPARRVRTWAGTYEVRGLLWSDAGIVVVKVKTTCGLMPTGSTLVDPSTGAETALFGAERWPLDVGAGLRVAMGMDLQTLYVAGTAQITRTYPLPIHVARIAPAGSRLFVSTFGEEGCGGQQKAATSVVEVPSATQTTIDGFFADAWLDDSHVLGRSLVTDPRGGFGWSAHVLVADLSGQESELALGRLVGVLRP